MDKAEPRETPYVVPLASDSAAAKSLVQTINALYNRKLELHWLTLGRGPNESVEERISNDVDEASTDTDGEPAVVFQQTFHFEAVVPADKQPAQQDTPLEQCEKQTGAAVEKLQKRRGNINEFIAAVGHERKAVQALMREQDRLLSKRVIYSLLPASDSIDETKRDFFKEIGDRYHAARCELEIQSLKTKFNERIDFLIENIKELLSPAQEQQLVGYKLQEVVETLA